jgi:predicted MPP superfamily phosphohydrolase
LREWGYFLFYVSFFFFYFSAGAYAAWRINAGLKIAAPYKYYLYAAAALMSAVSTFAYICSRYNIDPLAYHLSIIGGIWMGIAAISFSVLLINDLLNFANYIFKIKRFRHYSTIISIILIILLCAWSFINVAVILKVKEIKIKAPQLKTDRLSITLLADMHIDKQTSFESIRQIVDTANSLNSDIIAIAGDLIDIDISETYSQYGLDKLRAKYGIFAVTGNHEYFTGVKHYIELCKKLGFVLLRNESFSVNDNGKEIITVAGINDKEGIKFKVDAPDIEAAFAEIAKDDTVLFLSHRPETFDAAARHEHKIIQLSGHTHAGQIPPLEIIRRFMKYNYGMYEYGDSKMYVTSGSRWWRIPMRTFNTSEIVKIVLEK